MRGEDLAMRFLQKNKFVVVERNFIPRGVKGEIDIVAWEGETLVFVEVKSALTDERGTPDRAVDFYKRQALERAGRAYCNKARVEWEKCRFDIVTILGSADSKIEHFRGAF